MKRILCAILVLITTFATSALVVAIGNEQQCLSELPDEACMAFLETYGVEIPTIFDEENIDCVTFVRTIIRKVEENPDTDCLYGYSVLSQFANDIKTAVIEYYSGTEISAYTLVESEENLLQDSTLYGEWTDAYSLYNCYAYAIGRTKACDSGMFHWVSLGNDAEKYSYNWYANMTTIVYWIEQDFDYLGYNVLSVGTSMPEVSVQSHTNLICVRKDADGILIGQTTDGTDVYFHDYHFMKMGTDGNWYHKPGQTNPLKYKYTPSNDRAWLSEGYDGSTGTYIFDENLTYDSEIYFIEYTTPHVWEYSFTGTGQHIKSCDICGDSETIACTKGYMYCGNEESWHRHHLECTVCGGEYSTVYECSFEYTENGDGTHYAECTVCGYSYDGDCSYECAYTGDGSTHTHGDIRVDCGHETNTAYCSFTYVFNGTVDGVNTHVNKCTTCGYIKGSVKECTYKIDDNCILCGTSRYLSSELSVEEETITE